MVTFKQSIFPFRNIVCLPQYWVYIIYLCSFITTILIYRFIIFKIHKDEFQLTQRQVIHLRLLWKHDRFVGYGNRKKEQRGFYKTRKEASSEFKEYNDKHIGQIHYNSILTDDILRIIFEYAPMDMVVMEESLVAKLVNDIYLYSTIYGILTYIVTLINLYMIISEYVYWYNNTDYNNWNYYNGIGISLFLLQPFMRCFNHLPWYCYQTATNPGDVDLPWGIDGIDDNLLRYFAIHGVSLCIEQSYHAFWGIPVIYLLVYLCFFVPLFVYMIAIGLAWYMSMLGLVVIFRVIQCILQSFVCCKWYRKYMKSNEVLKRLTLVWKFMMLAGFVMGIQWGLWFSVTRTSIQWFKTRDIIGLDNNWQMSGCEMSDESEWSASEIFMIVSWILF